MNDRNRKIILIAVLLGLPLASFLLVFKPQRASIERAKGEISAKRAELERLREETAKNEDLERANVAIERRVDRIEERLPNRRELDDVVRRVSTLAVAAGLNPPEVKTRRTLAAADYREQPLEFTTSGNFEEFAGFLLQLEALPRLTRITDFELKRERDDGRDLSITFTLSVYFQESGAVASAEG
ncbi:MAG: type 4a pilus biogenesis protein PilO [Planctomycetota bacterium]